MGDQQTTIAQVAEQMRWWTSIELDVCDKNEYSEEFVASVSKFGGSPARQIDYHYEETAAGERRQITVMTHRDGRVDRTEDYFGGRKAAAAGDGKQAGVVSKGDPFGDEQRIGIVNRPPPLRYHYVGKIPLYEALQKGRSLGEEEIASTPCIKYMFDNVVIGQGPQSHLYYLRKEDSLPIRIESYKGPDPAAGPKLWIWEADKVDVVQGHPFVMKSHSIIYKRDSTAVLATHYFEVKGITFNKKVGMDMFRPAVAPGAEVRDAIAVTSRPPAREASVAGCAEPGSLVGAVGTAVPPAGSTRIVLNAPEGLAALLVLVSLAIRLRR